MDGQNNYFGALFFCSLIIFGSYFLLNLILAVIIQAYTQIDLKEKRKEKEDMEKQANAVQRRIDAIKTVFRMTRLSEQKQELYRKANKAYRKSIFDVVFESLKRRRYEKTIDQGVVKKVYIEKGRNTFQQEAFSLD